MEFSLRSATESDIGFLLALRDKTMRYYLEEVGMPTCREEYEKRIRYQFDHAKIVEMAGKPVGLFKAAYNSELNHWSLVQIQIAPEYQGMNIGSRLIRQLIEQAKGAGATVGLSVIKTNPAQDLYSRLGFKVVSSSGSELMMEWHS
ncbi:N-acetyltransferase [Photobacterium gaetbulicola]|uniref:Putative GCN5-related N-acetyltransferase n=1 Tax=Photobacterium gaetbulicola Gung47 TaxID=658445 RepID=A0A0C5WRW1_9GAMM|nr:GNAT family N-acetyltransferase [Photobacterium gaetbulicola]AJR05700.1 putative GCN5-related N-acetyltransferase [Photobacterium gaetbulicola Gung47]PSU14669.1 N-acetyltransferase [Photobacterium gaetbulicola]